MKNAEIVDKMVRDAKEVAQEAERAERATALARWAANIAEDLAKEKRFEADLAAAQAKRTPNCNADAAAYDANACAEDVEFCARKAHECWISADDSSNDSTYSGYQTAKTPHKNTEDAERKAAEALWWAARAAAAAIKGDGMPLTATEIADAAERLSGEYPEA